MDGGYRFSSTKTYLVDDRTLDRHERQCDILTQKVLSRYGAFGVYGDEFIHDVYFDPDSALAPAEYMAQVEGDPRLGRAIRSYLRYRVVIPAAMAKADRLELLGRLRGS